MLNRPRPRRTPLSFRQHSVDLTVGTYRRRLERQLIELEDQLAHDRANLAQAGGVAHSQATVHPGDLVQIRGQWYPVVRSNPKTVSVPGAVYQAESHHTRTTPWREVQTHLPRAAATADQVRQLAAGTSPALPGLRRHLEQLAESLP